PLLSNASCHNASRSARAHHDHIIRFVIRHGWSPFAADSKREFSSLYLPILVKSAFRFKQKISNFRYNEHRHWLRV
ncbi:MAG: hypothetical protein V3T77_07185, partial [Planctomycetota bacterium]